VTCGFGTGGAGTATTRTGGAGGGGGGPIGDISGINNCRSEIDCGRSKGKINNPRVHNTRENSETKNYRPFYLSFSGNVAGRSLKMTASMSTSHYSCRSSNQFLPADGLLQELQSSKLQNGSFG